MTAPSVLFAWLVNDPVFAASVTANRTYALQTCQLKHIAHEDVAMLVPAVIHHCISLFCLLQDVRVFINAIG